jgi:hypothetical protein
VGFGLHLCIDWHILYAMLHMRRSTFLDRFETLSLAVLGRVLLAWWTRLGMYAYSIYWVVFIYREVKFCMRLSGSMGSPGWVLEDGPRTTGSVDCEWLVTCILERFLSVLSCVGSPVWVNCLHGRCRRWYVILYCTSAVEGRMHTAQVLALLQANAGRLCGDEDRTRDGYVSQ